MDKKLLSADSIGEAARFDPQLKIPVKPRVRRGLVTYFESDRVIIEGGPKRQVLGGASATSLLPKMFGLLNGEKTHSEIAEQLQVTEDVVFKVTSLLWTSGIVEEGPPEAARQHIFDEKLADFLSRAGDSTGTNRSWEDAIERLAEVRIEIFGSTKLADSISSELEDPIKWKFGAGHSPSEDTTLVLLLLEEDSTEHQPLVDWCWENDLPLLRLKLSGRKAILGPYVNSRFGPCLACLTLEENPEPISKSEADFQLAASLFVREIISLLSRAVTVTLPAHWKRIDLDSLAASNLSGVSRPGCPRCSAARGAMSSTVSAASSYEASVAMPPKQYADLKAHQMHYKPSNLALQQKFKSWPVARKIHLPEPALDLLKQKRLFDTPADVSVGNLSILLKTMAGIRFITEDRVQRWTAAGGNIGSVTAYLIIRDVPDLAPGCYAYVAESHSLAFLSALDESVASGPSASLILAGNYLKVASKYSAFALRIVLLDAGCAVGTGLQVSNTIGLKFRVQSRWDDEDLGRALGLDLDLEPLTSLINLGE